jgi:hypothetical protein
MKAEGIEVLNAKIEEVGAELDNSFEPFLIHGQPYSEPKGLADYATWAEEVDAVQ